MRDESLTLLSFKKILTAPLERLSTDTPVWGWWAAWLGAAWQWLKGDAFSSLLAIIVFVGAADYYYGVKSAKMRERFSPTLAQRGVHGKMSGVVLLLGVRLFEGWATSAALVDSKGAVATALGIALLSVDFQSIAHHRESFGATPIPVLSNVLGWMRGMTSLREPPPPPPDSQGGP